MCAALCDLGLQIDPVKTGPVGRTARNGSCTTQVTGHDLPSGGRKLVGCAQRRRGARLLEHGVVTLVAGPLSGPSSTSIHELLGETLALAAFVRALSCVLQRAGLVLQIDSPTTDELTRAERLVTRRYGRSSWTRQGVLQ